MLGLTRGTTDAHVARAALESIALQSADVLEAMQLDARQQLSELRVDGGACVTIFCPRCRPTSSRRRWCAPP